MLFATHDFYHNIEGISKSKDKPLMKELIYSEIARLIATHKKELIVNILALNYKLPDTNDATIVDFVFEWAAKDQKVSDMLASMINKYNTEPKSNVLSEEGAELGTGIASGLGAIVGGVLGLVAANKQGKTDIEIAKLNSQATKDQAAMLLQIEAIKASQPQAGGLGKWGWVAIIGAAAIAITITLVVVLRKPKPIIIAAPVLAPAAI